MYEFFVKLTNDSGVDYAPDIDRLKEKLIELEEARDEAVGRIERANGLEIILSEKLTTLRGHSRRRSAKVSRRSGPASVDSSRDRSTGDEVVTISSARKSFLRKTLIVRSLIVAASVLVLSAAIAGALQLRNGENPALVTSKQASTPVPGNKESFDVDYQSVGQRGTVEIIVVPQNADLGALSNQLNKDFGHRSRVQVYAFDDIEAASYLLRTYDLDVSGYSSEQLAAEYSKYYPHWKATYFKDINNRLNQVEVYQDAQHLSSKIIRLPVPIN